MLLLSLFLACSSTKITKSLSKTLGSPFFNSHFTGMYFYDISANKVVYNYNGDKYFTPASNAKIFTLFTGLTLLNDSIPAFKYEVNKDTLTILSTGDPTFLHNYFNDSTALKMAEKFSKVQLILNNIEDKRYGPGWAWEDFDTYFSAERSAFPMYGNVVTIQNKDSVLIVPSYYQNKIKMTNNFGREEFSNKFFFRKDRTVMTEIPMIIDSILIANLWSHLLPNKVFIREGAKKKPTRVAYSVPSDSLFKRMMVESDNFLAEQVLVLASSTLSDTLSSARVRTYMLENELKDLKQQPRWVDGSGLSRYNLFSPKSFVEVLTKLYVSIPQPRLFNFFPVGGKSGTVKNWYAGKDIPYLFAKTGTVGNNYNVSGYLLTNSGKVLVFSYMSNHYRKSTNQIRTQMQKTFEWLRDTY